MKRIPILLAALSLAFLTGCRCNRKDPEEEKKPVLSVKTSGPMERTTSTVSPLRPFERPRYLKAPSDLAKPPETALHTPSGLVWRELYPGTGTAHPTDQSLVQYDFGIWTSEGKLHDSSQHASRPPTARVADLQPGLSEGMKLLVTGQKARFWIPENLAFRGEPGKPRGTVVYDIQVAAIQDPPSTPADVAAPPANAVVTPSGLASTVQQAGTGTAHPGPTSIVEVHYSGWTTDGKMFDSSVTRGEPASFPLDRVISGWTEGVQLMVEGEKRRLWIPVDLAYKGAPGKPTGMLVFDVELLRIVKP